MLPVGTFSNVILNSLGPESILRLKLTEVELPVQHYLKCAGKTPNYIYFLETGLASTTVLFENGHRVDVCSFGHEGLIGSGALTGWGKLAYETVMRIGGRGYKSSLSNALQEFRRQERFQERSLRYMHLQMMHAMQTSACNSTHDVDHRLAGWLLLCCDRLQCGALPLTHELLGEMLGIRRTTVSLTAEHLQRLGAIEYRRGVIHLGDRSALAKQACECYRLMREQLADYLGMPEPVAMLRPLSRNPGA
jgi:CRP-like cAMP-binding protein